MKRKLRLKIPQLFLCVGLSIAALGVSANSWGNVPGIDVINEKAQSGATISGVVMDKQDVIIGASIVVKGTTTGTITDFDGKFTLSNVPDGAEIQISYIGYVTQTIKVGTQRSFQIVLAEDSKTLDEVVVVGYGTQKKVNLTGSIGQVDSKVLESRPIVNTSTALQGTIANLQITPYSGEPGSNTSINIRGTTSINGGGPLVLVDGVEMDLDLVNPNDIENVTILKDAAAAAIYGVRAAFGVLLVTTKSGKSDNKTVINYSGNFSISKPTVMPEQVKSSWEHANFVNISRANAGSAPLFLEDQMNKIKAYEQDPRNNPEYEIIDGDYFFYGHTDWVGDMMKKYTPSHRHNINISGGNEKTKFYSSIGYFDESGIYKIGDNSFQRLNTRLNVDNQTTKWLKLGAKVLYNYTSKDKPHNYKDDPFRSMVFSVPTKNNKPWTSDPRYPEMDKFDGMYFADQNPVAYMTQGGQDKQKHHDLWLTGSADLTFLPNWKARVDFTYNLNYKRLNQDARRIGMIDNASLKETYGSTSPDFYQWENQNKDYYSFNAYTDYENTFAEKHYLKAMVGFNQELTKYQWFRARRDNMLLPELPSLSLGTGNQTVTESGYEWALRGAFFRLNYIYDNRYLIEFNGRYDGTSRFPKNDRYVFLPSFSGAWRISEEKFMQGTRSWLDNLKLRASYGALGNQLLSSTKDDWTATQRYYPYIPFMSSQEVNRWLFNSSNKILMMNPSNLVSSALTWEKAATVNGGIDITLFDQRLDLSFDYYERTTSSMLLKIAYPDVLGTTGPPTNGAKLKTKGWELTATWRDRIGKDFSYEVGLTLSDAQATITKYENPTGNINSYYVGKKVGEIWGFETMGFFQTQEDLDVHGPKQDGLAKNWQLGDIMYRDLDESGTVDKGSQTLDDHGDLKRIGNETPRYHYGINLSMSYKDIWFTAFIQGVGKRDFWSDNEAFWPAYTEHFATQKWHLDYWREDNRNAYFARPISRDYRNKEKQTKYLQDGSYMRLKNISLGYNLPKNWIKHVYLSKASVFISAENVFEISNVKGPYDPESARHGGVFQYPLNRIYSVGVNVTF